MWRKRVTGRKSKHGFPKQNTRFKSANQKWKSNPQKIVQLVSGIFNGEKNGLKIGKMLFTAQKGVEEEKIKIIKLINSSHLKNFFVILKS